MAQAERSGEIVEIVAANLARLRAQHHISISELAQRSGVAKATLSALEAGRANPTLETLWHLSTALQIPFSDLVAAPSSEEVRVTRITDLPLIGDADEHARLLDRLTGQRLVDVFDFICPPHTDRISPAHGSNVIEALLLLEGRLVTGPQDHTRSLRPGDLMHFPAGQQHRYTNSHSEPARAIVWIAYRSESV
jgi:transcriptional regulator with XRE-family HTH domain